MTMMERREFLAYSLAGTTMLGSTRLAWAAPAESQRRLVFILQRGAADGLHTIAPVGDPGFRTLRRQLADEFEAAPKLDGMFALHPAMERSAQFYKQGELCAVHAVASAYRSRSHFDGQNLLEIGADRPYARPDGWMNRLVGLLPGDPVGMAVSPVLPPAMMGPNRTTSYAPSRLPDPSTDFLARIDSLYQSDETLHGLWQESVRTRSLAEGIEAGNGRNAAQVGSLAAKLMKAEGGARVMMIETSGWDTHNGQRGRLNRELGNLDRLVGTLRDDLGDIWNDTLVIVATEFGRTAALNGTMGTDHGTASAAMFYGGSLNGGKVHSDWPGLKAADLYEGRDLKPTTSLEAEIIRRVSSHFALDPDLAARTLFPHTKA